MHPATGLVKAQTSLRCELVMMSLLSLGFLKGSDGPNPVVACQSAKGSLVNCHDYGMIFAPALIPAHVLKSFDVKALRLKGQADGEILYRIEIQP